MDMTPNFKTEFAQILDMDKKDVLGDVMLDESIWDSLAVVGTAALIDEEYSKIVDGEKLTNCKSINELMDLIEAS
tara:strand:- start:178 stop:402 length:225 start_codon:yes stop_codon:yes gene_type:complete